MAQSTSLPTPSPENDPWSEFPLAPPPQSTAAPETDVWAEFPLATPENVTPESWSEKAVRIGKDVALSTISGLDKGVAGLAGFPADLGGLIQSGVELAQSKFQGRPLEEVHAERAKDYVISPETLAAYGAESAHANSPLKHEPTSTAGEYASAVGEFAPAAAFPGSAAARAAQVIAPALASETAGQATKGTSWETPARIVGGLAGGVGAGMAMRPNAAGKILQNSAENVTQAEIDAAEALFNQARDIGAPISRAEALQHVTNGRTQMGGLQHKIEGMDNATMREFYAGRPASNDAAARRTFEDISPPAATPSEIGPTVSSTARQAMQESPEGRILDDTLWRAGPRITPEEAGTTIQRELNQVQEGREGMRSALADQDYGAARNAPAEIPVNGGHRIADVTTHYLDRPGAPIILDEAERNAAKAQLLKDNNPTSPTPIVGERPTEFAQVDAGPVVAHLDEALASAKGAVKQGLQAARGALMKANGEVDSSVAGLHNSREAIDDLISQAQRAGAKQTVMRLQQAKQELDRVLESVPAYGEARRNFKAASEPLAPFDADRVPGKITSRDQFNNDFTMPAERVPDAIQKGGPTALRDFVKVATPEAREAFEQNLVTQVLERATKEGTDLSSESIRQAIRQNEDALRLVPGVKDRLQSIAIARDGLAKIEKTPLGRLAKKDLTTKKAMDALFPSNPLPNSQNEIAEAVSELAKRRPLATRQLVRAHAEATFNETAQNLASGPSQGGGAKFAAVLRGNKQQAENLRAAIEALPDGKTIWKGFDRLLDVMEAQQRRVAVGSKTAFNTEGLKEMKKGSLSSEGINVLATGGLRLLAKPKEILDAWNLGRNSDQIARLLTSPDAGKMFRELLTAPPRSVKFNAAVGRLLSQANSGRLGGQAEHTLPAIVVDK